MSNPDPELSEGEAESKDLLLLFVALYQGTASAVPQTVARRIGF
jgi:hypothetical protein